MEARCFSGARLRETRVAAGLRPEHVAFSIERSVYSIHEYERGRVCPPAAVIDRLAQALGVTPGDLLDDEASAEENESDQLDRYVREVVANFPRLDSAQRCRIATLLRTSGGGST